MSYIVGDTPSKKRKRAREEGGRDDNKRAAKRLAICDYHNTIEVLVSNFKVSFTVYKDIICARSKFFKAACSKRWVEGQLKVVKLPEVSTSVFRRYLSWVYSGHLEWACPGDDTEEEADPDDEIHEMGMMIDLYILGHSLDDIQLRNKVVEILVTDVSFSPTCKQLNHLWENTHDSSPIRSMCANRLVLRHDRSDLADSMKSFPADLVQRIAMLSCQRLATVKRDEFEAGLSSYLEPAPANE